MVVNLFFDSRYVTKVILHLKIPSPKPELVFMDAAKLNDTCVLRTFSLLGTRGCEWGSQYGGKEGRTVGFRERFSGISDPADSPCQYDFWISYWWQGSGDSPGRWADSSTINLIFLRLTSLFTVQVMLQPYGSISDGHVHVTKEVYVPLFWKV